MDWVRTATEASVTDSTKVQTLGAISESFIMRQDTAPQLYYSMGHGPTRCIPVKTELVSRRLSASAGKPDCTSALPRCAGQLVAKAKRRAAGRGILYAGGWVGTGGWGVARPMVRTRACSHR